MAGTIGRRQQAQRRSAGGVIFSLFLFVIYAIHSSRLSCIDGKKLLTTVAVAYCDSR